MTWRRLPSFFPNLSLKLLPLEQAAQETFAKTGFLSPLAFRVAPSVNKARRGGRGRAPVVGGPAALQAAAAAAAA